MYNAVRDPHTETYQNNIWNTGGRQGLRDRGPRRSAPAELPYAVQAGGQWTIGGHPAPRIRPRLYMVRPHDGKRAGASGRFLDAMQSEGPDVFVMKCGDKRTFMRDRPQRWQWSGWPLTLQQRQDLSIFDKDFRAKDLAPIQNFLPVHEKARISKGHYNFKTRKYENLARLQRGAPGDCWTDARWWDDVKRRAPAPLSYRDDRYQWWTKIDPSAGQWPGGRPRT